MVWSVAIFMLRCKLERGGCAVLSMVMDALDLVVKMAEYIE